MRRENFDPGKAPFLSVEECQGAVEECQGAEEMVVGRRCTFMEIMGRKGGMGLGKGDNN